MSDYNKSTGIFGLNIAKAHYWFRRADCPTPCTKHDPENEMDFDGCLLVNAGLNVVHVDRAIDLRSRERSLQPKVNLACGAIETIPD